MNAMNWIRPKIQLKALIYRLLFQKLQYSRNTAHCLRPSSYWSKSNDYKKISINFILLIVFGNAVITEAAMAPSRLADDHAWLAIFPEHYWRVDLYQSWSTLELIFLWCWFGFLNFFIYILSQLCHLYVILLVRLSLISQRFLSLIIKLCVSIL